MLSAEARLKRSECKGDLDDVIVEKTDAANSYNALFGVSILHDHSKPNPF